MPKSHNSKPSPVPIFESVYQGSAPVPLFDFVKTTAQISGRSLHKYFFKGLILVNGRKAHSSALLQPGATVKVMGMKEQATLTPEAMPLEIVFENDDLLIINKPAMIVVHPVKDITAGTLSNGVANYFQKTGLTAKVRPVNRLDYGTSGLIIFAKTAQAQVKASEAIQNHFIQRIYYALVQGVPEPPEGVINLPIREVKGKRMVARPGANEGGQPAETLYRIIETFSTASLVELSLKTGRTHQIRVHLSAIGCPILGDPQYGVKSPGSAGKTLIHHPALHAGKLDFTNSGFKIPELTAPLPPDFQNLVDFFRNKT